MKKNITLVVSCAAVLAACSSETGSSETELEKNALLGVKSYVGSELDKLASASAALQTASPAPDTDGWSASSEAAAVATMRQEWKNARNAYERVEGAIAVLFPNLDVATDERYDGFLEESADENLFDDEGVIGVHAIERILWADQHPPEVVAFEQALTGYKPASFPANDAEAGDFKTKLVARLVRDTNTMRDDFAPLALDVAAAYRGVIGSMGEQVEKVALASTGESESRYANHTLADMRANLAGGLEIFAEFEPWLTTKPNGPTLIMQIRDAFARVQAEYATHSGDGIPAVPEGWNPDAPSAEHLATPYGRLWSLLSNEADPARDGSLVSLMNQGADMLGIPQLPE
jgi:iron uptake system component EfeO